MNMTQKDQELWVLHLKNLRSQNVNSFSQSVDHVFAQRPRTLVLNCKELQTLDYQGLKALLSCLKKSLDSECKLYLQALAAGPRMILEVTRTLQLFNEMEV